MSWISLNRSKVTFFVCFNLFLCKCPFVRKIFLSTFHFIVTIVREIWPPEVLLGITSRNWYFLDNIFTFFLWYVCTLQIHKKTFLTNKEYEGWKFVSVTSFVMRDWFSCQRTFILEYVNSREKIKISLNDDKKEE